MQAAKLKTELVDWKVLNGKGDKAKSDELMRHVATLFALTANHCTKEQIETYNTVMQRLADLVCTETRSFAARKICHLDNAPHEIVKRFAFDVISVAEPVLRHSPVLSDDDLVEICDSKGEEHMVSICMRKELTCVVTDVLIRSEHGSVLIKLAANSEAEISAIGMSVLERAAANDQDLASELSQRNDRRNQRSRSRIGRVVKAAKLSLPDLWVKIQPGVTESYYDLSVHPYLSRYRFDSSLAKTERLYKQGLMDKGILRQFANNDQYADLVCGLSHMVGFPHPIVARMTSSSNFDQALSLFKLLGFSDHLVRDILGCGPWMLCLSPNQCNAVLRQYQELTIEDAKSRALLWPQDGLFLD